MKATRILIHAFLLSLFSSTAGFAAETQRSVDDLDFKPNVNQWNALVSASFGFSNQNTQFFEQTSYQSNVNSQIFVLDRLAVGWGFSHQYLRFQTDGGAPADFHQISSGPLLTYYPFVYQRFAGRVGFAGAIEVPIGDAVREVQINTAASIGADYFIYKNIGFGPTLSYQLGFPTGGGDAAQTFFAQLGFSILL
jgi:hypothetical protein